MNLITWARCDRIYTPRQMGLRLGNSDPKLTIQSFTINELVGPKIGSFFLLLFLTCVELLLITNSQL